MSIASIFIIAIIATVFLIQLIGYVKEYYEKKNPRYVRVYTYIKKRLADVDAGYTTLTDVRYELITKFSLTPSEAFECLSHSYDDTDKWFKENIV